MSFSPSPSTTPDVMVVEPGTAAQSWSLIFITSTASVLGSCLISIDVLWNLVSHRKFSILHSDKFLGIALSMSSGTLVVAGLNSVLPKAEEYIKTGRPDLSDRAVNALLVPAYGVGVVLCLSMNWLVYHLASDSIVACPHDLDTISRPKNVSHERLPLLDGGVHDHGAVRCEQNHHDPAAGSSLHHLHHDAEAARGDAQAHPCADHSHNEHHHGAALTEERSSGVQLLAIGLQTALGISIHRIPEGILLFATSSADRQLGLSLLLAMTIHSFSEGFAIAAPLYAALQNRLLVVFLAALLGCAPQLLGGYVGSLIFRDHTALSPNASFTFGICMSATSGFMIVVCTQMLSSAYRYMSQNAVLYGVIAGTLLSLGSRAI